MGKPNEIESLDTSLIPQRDDPIAAEIDTISPPSPIALPGRVADANVDDVQLPVVAVAGNTGIQDPDLGSAEGDDDFGSDVEWLAVEVGDFSC
jgi:hypothetical protein